MISGVTAISNLPVVGMIVGVILLAAFTIAFCVGREIWNGRFLRVAGVLMGMQTFNLVLEWVNWLLLLWLRV